MSSSLDHAIEAAKSQNGLPLLVHVLGKENITLDKDSLALHRKQYIHNYLSSAIFLKELQHLLPALNDGGIEIILLKGAAFSTDLYPEPGIRPLRDIDLLIHKKDIAAVTGILHSSGYQRYSPPARAVIDDFHGQIAFIKEEDPAMIIEPHWKLSPEFAYSRNIKIDDFWQRSMKVKLSEIETHVLSTEDNLIHLCLHLFLHMGGAWFNNACDIAALIRHCDGGVNWDSFLKRVSEYHLCLPAQYSLNKAVELLGADVPDFVLNNLNDYKPTRTELSLSGLRANFSGPLGRENIATLLTVPGFISKCRYFCSLLFPSRAWLKTYYETSTKGSLMLYVFHARMIVVGVSKLLSKLVISSAKSRFKLRP